MLASQFNDIETITSFFNSNLPISREIIEHLLKYNEDVETYCANPGRNIQNLVVDGLNSDPIARGRVISLIRDKLRSLQSPEESRATAIAAHAAIAIPEDLPAAVVPELEELHRGGLAPRVAVRVNSAPPCGTRTVLVATIIIVIAAICLAAYLKTQRDSSSSF